MSHHITAEKLAHALAQDWSEDGGNFDPWGGLIVGIAHYSSECDRLLIGALEAVRDRANFAFIDKEGFAGELMLYVLADHDMIEYGTSPRGGWVRPELQPHWQPLIDKWKAYYADTWES